MLTDLHFWRTSQHWQSNVDALLNRNAVFVKGVNVYTARHDLWRLPRNYFSETSIPITPQTIGLVVFAGFHPHRHTATALQALTAQFPKADAREMKSLPIRKISFTYRLGQQIRTQVLRSVQDQMGNLAHLAAGVLRSSLAVCCTPQN